MSAYYSEWNKQKAVWLRQLIKDGRIADGEVDERDIRDVRPEDVRGFAQCHWFAGIGGWSLALRYARWDDSRPVWTGSCPCQALSSASRGRRTAEDLAPAFRHLIVASRPPVVFGEQVADDEWVDRFCDAVEAVDYEVWASVLPALSVGQDHLRPRVYFACYANSDGESGRAIDAKASRLPRAQGNAAGVVPAHGVSRDMVALAGFGDAIVPQVAAEFIASYMTSNLVSRRRVGQRP